MSEFVHDLNRYEFRSGKVSLDFRLDVPKAPHEDLKSSVTIEEGLVDCFELRLGLLSRDQYEPDEIREEMNAIVGEMDLPRTRYRAQREEIIEMEVEEHGLDPERIPDKDPDDEINPKISYDPHWGELGFYQIHLECHSFWPPIWHEDEFMEFVEAYTAEFVERFDWDDLDD